MTLADIQNAITNRLPDVRTELVAGIIGDRPSQSAKSPSIWNPTFEALELPVSYLPFDVDAAGLPGLVETLRASDRFIGGNVTMPHKVAVLPLLDEVDERAASIGAVNTIVRTREGRLVGYNTDGQGGLDALGQPQRGQPALLPDLQGRRVLVIGAGGAGRALAVYLAEAIGRDGTLHLANRSAAHADAVVEAVRRRVANCRRVDEIAPAGYDLVINASTVGQAGIRSLADGRVTCLEPFSPLAASEAPEAEAPSPTEAGVEARFYRDWTSRAAAAIGRNNEASLALLVETPERVAFYDVIFAPLETTLLRQARLTGHRTLNGRAMSVAQAADGFFNRVCRDLLERRGLWRPEVAERVRTIMSSVW